jgi:hypothetical protein
MNRLKDRLESGHSTAILVGSVLGSGLAIRYVCRGAVIFVV